MPMKTRMRSGLFVASGELNMSASGPQATTGWHVLLKAESVVRIGMFFCVAVFATGCMDEAMVAPGDPHDPFSGERIEQEDPWLDDSTGLYWENTNTDKEDPFEIQMTWDAAMSYCQDLSLGGFSDWHLPTVSEMRSIINGCPHTQSGGSCNITDDCPTYECASIGDWPCAPSCAEWEHRTGCFNFYCNGNECAQACKSGPADSACFWKHGLKGHCPGYWTSTLIPGETYAWVIDFRSAEINAFYPTVSTPESSSERFVRCVRP